MLLIIFIILKGKFTPNFKQLTGWI